MSKHLVSDLDAASRSLLESSTIAEEMVDLAIKSLRFRQFELIDQVGRLEDEINRREVQIEGQALQLIALHQPVASDLRRAAAILKINSDIERIADMAINISERAECLAPRPDFEMPSMLVEMTILTHSMLREALDAFGRDDVELARSVCARDDEVDELHRQLVNELYRAMRSDPELIDPALNYFSIARHVERVADHATNIAEAVIYMVEGEIARHGSTNY